jgi:arylsulfatase A-like enzyme
VSQPDARPNILFLQADDLARAAISSYGGHLSSVLRTPNIDKLAAEGARFERSFVTNSLCAPSRTVILTGLHSHENGVIQIGQSALSNGQLPKSDPKSNGRVFQIPRRVKSYPELLRSSGHYSTAQFGKYHSHDWLFGVRAFEYFRPFKEHISWNPQLCDPREHRRCAPEATKGFETELLADLAIKWLRPWTDTESRNDCRPFYLEVDFKATHEPWDHPKHVDGLYRDVVFPEPAGLQHVWGGATSDATAVREAAQVAKACRVGLMADKMGPTKEYQCGKCTASAQVQRLALKICDSEHVDIHNESARRSAVYQAYLGEYARSTAALDDAVGRIVRAIDSAAALGLRDRTVIVFVSDQGYYLGEHGRTDKRLMYEEGLFFPLIVRHPPEIAAGSLPSEMASNLDIAPTMLDWGQVEEPEMRIMSGRSLRPALRGHATTDWRTSVYYRYVAHSDAIPAHMGVRTARWKLIFWYSHSCSRHSHAAQNAAASLIESGGEPLTTSTGEGAAARKKTAYAETVNFDDFIIRGVNTSWELFDLENDPHEMHNVYANSAFAQQRCELTRELLRLKAEARDHDELHCPEMTRSATNGVIRLHELCVAPPTLNVKFANPSAESKALSECGKRNDAVSAVKLMLAQSQGGGARGGTGEKQPGK